MVPFIGVRSDEDSRDGRRNTGSNEKSGGKRRSKKGDGAGLNFLGQHFLVPL